MDDIANACEAIIEVIRELIIDRAFDKKNLVKEYRLF